MNISQKLNQGITEIDQRLMVIPQKIIISLFLPFEIKIHLPI